MNNIQHKTAIASSSSSSSSLISSSSSTSSSSALNSHSLQTSPTPSSSSSSSPTPTFPVTCALSNNSSKTSSSTTLTPPSAATSLALASESSSSSSTSSATITLQQTSLLHTLAPTSPTPPPTPPTPPPSASNSNTPSPPSSPFAGISLNFSPPTAQNSCGSGSLSTSPREEAEETCTNSCCSYPTFEQIKQKLKNQESQTQLTLLNSLLLSSTANAAVVQHIPHSTLVRSVTATSIMDMPYNTSPSLRVRTTSLNQLKKTADLAIENELHVCPSEMPDELRKLLPPTSETVMTKPLPIRGERAISDVSTPHVIAMVGLPAYYKISSNI